MYRLDTYSSILVSRAIVSVLLILRLFKIIICVPSSTLLGPALSLLPGGSGLGATSSEPGGQEGSEQAAGSETGL